MRSESSEQRRERAARDRPGDGTLNPPTKRSADGSTTLHRFRVDGVIYAPSLAEARRRARHSIEFDAVKVRRG